MKSQEKAKELYLKYHNLWINGNSIMAKQCALIAVDEILEATKKYIAIREKVNYSKTGFDNVVHAQYDKYWQEVKTEIEKL